MKSFLERTRQELSDIEIQLAGVRRVVSESRQGGAMGVSGRTRSLTARDYHAARTIEAQLIARQGALQRQIESRRLRLL